MPSTTAAPEPFVDVNIARPHSARSTNTVSRMRLNAKSTSATRFGPIFTFSLNYRPTQRTRVPARLEITMAAAAVALAFAFAGQAHAEMCNADGRICLLNEATREHPLVSGQLFRVSTPSEMTRVRVEPSRRNVSFEPISHGPPGGSSVWEFELMKGQDGPSRVRVWAGVPGDPNQAKAEFPAQMLTSVGKVRMTVKPTGRWLVQRMTFDARIAVRTNLLFAIDGSDYPDPNHPDAPVDSTTIGPIWKRGVVTPAGRQAVFVQRFNLRKVKRKCRPLDYCQWTGEAHVHSVRTGIAVEVSTFFGERVPGKFFP